MAGGGWSNIFLQLMAGDTPPKIGLPVIGEGQLELPWMTQIELLSFSWSIEVEHKDKIKSGSLLGAAAGMAAGAVAGNVAGAVGGQAGLAVAAAAAATASALKDFKDVQKVDLGTLTMKKRFDIASARIQSCADMDIPIQSALISVLHIKQGARTIHEPGFMLLATNGRFEKVDVKMDKSEKGVEVTETLELKFKNIVVTYSKRLGVDNIPMPPFVYASPKDPGGGSLW
jgi:type VI protein secretion system component Hcp